MKKALYCQSWQHIEEKRSPDRASFSLQRLLLFLFIISFVFAINGCTKKKIDKLQPGVWISIENGYDGAFSPDGKAVVYTHSVKGRPWKEDLWMYSMSKGTREPLLRNIFWDGEARFSPDGKLLIFTSDVVHLKNLNIMAFPDGEPQEITKAGAKHPCWSPDGKKVIFISDRSGYPEIWQLTLESMIFNKLTELEKNIATPVWAPDNSGIVFSLFTGQQWDLWFLSFSESRVFPLFNTLRHEAYPCFSQSGRFAAFCSFTDSGEEGQKPSQIWLVPWQNGRVDGEAMLVAEASEPGEKLFYPQFSPDESLLLFSSNRKGYRWDTGFISLKKYISAIDQK